MVMIIGNDIITNGNDNFSIHLFKTLSCHRAIPGCLGSLGGFKNRFSDPIEQGQKHTVTKRGLAEGRKAVQELAKKLSHWFLRRTKAIISDQLPKKDDRVSYFKSKKPTDFK